MSAHLYQVKSQKFSKSPKVFFKPCPGNRPIKMKGIIVLQYSAHLTNLNKDIKLSFGLLGKD